MNTSPDTSNSSPTRRRVLGWGGAGVIGGLASYWGWQQQPSETVIKAKTAVAPHSSESLPDSQSSETPSSVGGIHREDFLPHLKSAFQLDSVTRCTLIDVGVTQKLTSPTAEFTSFSLLFAVPITFVPESKIYQLTHQQMGPMEVFLSPIGVSKEQMHLEAVFSQRV